MLPVSAIFIFWNNLKKIYTSSFNIVRILAEANNMLVVKLLFIPHFRFYRISKKLKII